MTPEERERAFWNMVDKRGYMRYMLGLIPKNVKGVVVIDLEGTDTKIVWVTHPPDMLPWYSPPPCIVQRS